MWSPGATRYCFPPLTTTADSELSGLGTASDCTKLGDRLVHGTPSHGHGLDESKRRQEQEMWEAEQKAEKKRVAELEGSLQQKFEDELVCDLAQLSMHPTKNHLF